MEERKGLEEIEDCFPLLMSEDWKKRLIGEYWEMKIRCAALKEEIEWRTEEEHKWNETMEHHIMSRQLSDMLGYLSCLGLRATEKEIDLMDTEVSESECFISISGNAEMGQAQLKGCRELCLRALLGTTAETAIILRKEEVPTKEFIRGMVINFIECLCEAERGSEHENEKAGSYL